MSASPAKAQTNELAARPLLRRTLTARQPTILVVEDHDDSREMLCILLTMWGCRVVEACNGLQAVEAASREQPALILMEGRLPFLDGLGATRRIRENRPGDQVKILALNGWGESELSCGCTGRWL